MPPNPSHGPFPWEVAKKCHYHFFQCKFRVNSRMECFLDKHQLCYHFSVSMVSLQGSSGNNGLTGLNGLCLNIRLIFFFFWKHLFQSITLKKSIHMMRIQYGRAIKICSPSSLDVSYSSDAIISLCHITHFRIISTFNDFLRTKICFCIRKSKKQTKNSLITCKKDSIDFMYLFLIWILFSIRIALQRYTTWPDFKVTKRYHGVGDTKSAILNMTPVT